MLLYLSQRDTEENQGAYIVSGSGPKSRSKSGRIKFFKIDRGGEIAPAFPDEKAANEATEAEGGTRTSNLDRMEPVFNPEPEFTEGSVAIEPTNQAVQNEIDLLQPQVDHISRMSTKDDLDSNQVDILRRYLSLKEAESRDLREQQRQYQAYLKKLGHQINQLNSKNHETLTELELVRRREESLRAELRTMKDKFQDEVALLKNDYEDKLRRSGNFESAAEELERQRDEWKGKVREDLKRIKLKERELENKYELLKRDTQALLDSKDKHVLELKKKNDALELEMENLEERLRKTNVVLNSMDAKKKRLVETLRLAISLLEQIDSLDEPPPSDE